MSFEKVLLDVIKLSAPVVNIVGKDFTLLWDLKEVIKESVRREVYFVPSNEYVNKTYLEQRGFFNHVLVEYNFDEKNRFQPYVAYIRESLDALRSRKSTLIVFTSDAISEGFVFQLSAPPVDLEKVYNDVVESFKQTGRLLNVSDNFKRHLFALVQGLSRVQAENLFYYALHRYFPGKEQELLDEILEYKSFEFSKVGLEILHPVSDRELGGFERYKTYISKIAKVFETSNHVFPPKGILLCGIPGTGKTLAAKVAGYYFGFPVVRLDVGRLLSKWVGESEKRFTTAIETIESLAPVVVLVDELEKVFAVGHEVTQRIMGNFLFWLQEKRSDVYVVATSNRIDMLPPELTRIGRWDRLFFVDLPKEGHRAEIFRIHLGKVGVRLSEDELLSLARETEGFSGAEIEQVVKDAYYESLSDGKEMNFSLLREGILGVTPLSRYRVEEIKSLRELLNKGWQEV